MWLLPRLSINTMMMLGVSPAGITGFTGVYQRSRAPWLSSRKGPPSSFSSVGR